MTRLTMRHFSHDVTTGVTKFWIGVVALGFAGLCCCVEVKVAVIVARYLFRSSC